MPSTRRLLITILCCGAIGLPIGACADDKPAGAEKKSTRSAADETATTVDKSETASRPTKKQTTRKREHHKGTASTGAREGARGGQASTSTTPAQRRSAAKAERLARSGAVATEAPSTDSRRAQDSGAVDNWELYQQRKKNSAK